MVRHVYGERVTFHSGDGEVAPGVTVHRVGGHSDGLQVVRVETERGPVVLASDAAHYYANLHKRSPFPIVYNVGDMAQGWETVERLAGHPDRFIPGHDPIVTRDLSARQRQGRCLGPAHAAVALVREIAFRRMQTDGTEYKTIGFIGLGVMGEPICRNLVKKSGRRVLAFDLSAEPLARLRADGADVAASVADVIKQSELLFLCLPSAKHVRAVFEGDGILKNIRSGQIVVDLGTSSVSQTRDFAKQLRRRARPGSMRRSRARGRRRRTARSASWSAARASCMPRSNR